MNIELTPERLAALAKEAEIRNATLEEGAPPHTAESIAQNMLDKACDSYAATQQRQYAEGLYARILAADPDKQKAAFAAAEQAIA